MTTSNNKSFFTGLSFLGLANLRSVPRSSREHLPSYDTSVNAAGSGAATPTTADGSATTGSARCDQS